MGARAQVLLVEGVQDRMPCPVGRGTGPGGLVTAEVLALAAEGALVDLAVVESGKRYPGVFQLVNRWNRLAAHELYGVLVTEIVGALDRVEHVPVPVVRQHVRQRCIDAALGGNRMGPCWKYLRDHRHAVARARQLQRGVQPRSACPDDQGIEAPLRQTHAAYPATLTRKMTCATHSPVPVSAVAKTDSTTTRSARGCT